MKDTLSMSVELFSLLVILITGGIPISAYFYNILQKRTIYNENIKFNVGSVIKHRDGSHVIVIAKRESYVSLLNDNMVYNRPNIEMRFSLGVDKQYKVTRL